RTLAAQKQQSGCAAPAKHGYLASQGCNSLEFTQDTRGMLDKCSPRAKSAHSGDLSRPDSHGMGQIRDHGSLCVASTQGLAHDGWQTLLEIRVGAYRQRRLVKHQATERSLVSGGPQCAQRPVRMADDVDGAGIDRLGQCKNIVKFSLDRIPAAVFAVSIST